jgi:hypothetical protein
MPLSGLFDSTANRAVLRSVKHYIATVLHIYDVQQFYNDFSGKCIENSSEHSYIP